MGRRTAPERPLTLRPDPGLYGPGSEAWRLNREAALLLGAGPRALLLQLAHPLVAEGVDQHSAFRADPWARLAATLRSYLRIVYGAGPAARAEIRRLNRLHAAIGGPVTDPGARDRFGTAYAARTPELSLWVHATLVDSTLATVDAWMGPLPPACRARFYAETLPVGRLFGIPEALLPRDVDAFDTWMTAQWAPGGPVHPTQVSRALAASILRPPLAPLVTRGPLAGRLGRAAGPVARPLARIPAGAVAPLLLPAIGLLPDAVRREYGFGWGPPERAVATWLTAGWRAWRPVLPHGVRWFPQALAADARMGPGR